MWPLVRFFIIRLILRVLIKKLQKPYQSVALRGAENFAEKGRAIGCLRRKWLKALALSIKIPPL